MQTSSIDRRRFLASTLLGGSAAALMPFAGESTAQEVSTRSAANDIGVGCIGMRYQGSVIANKAAMYGKIVAVCDVDRHVRDQAKASFGSTPRAFEDYRDLLKRKDVDVVTIGTPDHWHTKMVIDACRAGKDVYCEKPLTLTIEEGQQLQRVVEETGRVVQVGSWQRSDHRFRLAVEMIRQGRIGKLTRVDVVLGKNKTGGPFQSGEAPHNLNWDLWQGQTPDVPYIQERCHYTFRWWKEYSGGQMTDWGAHHLDIAQWAIDSLPVEIQGNAKWPKVQDGYNVPIDFNVTYQYENGVTMTVADEGRNGILFTGDEGRIFVNRGTVSGKPVEELAKHPLERQDWKVYEFDNLDRPERAGKLDAIVNHMGNFFDCIRTRKKPISDVESQHRSVSTCHLGNIALQLGRTLKWNPQTEEFIDDTTANALRRRDQREGFETA
ncbi:Gfo/Idh/MocA family protein [Thalassoroseus pseudoceratinae]|uniref:Gfo/Idh/MocA family protein n=1 Tax=Thalassoroseus pseudoceratinae TaxID=2713176 RepID=UPI0014212505|nr:Gfo/Idh/MocA family oxidoreductase [Thalassoroseus pseudoceratinae]